MKLTKEIKCRAKMKNRDKIIYGYYCPRFEFPCVDEINENDFTRLREVPCLLVQSNSYNPQYEIDPNTLQQLRLYDSFGRMVFDGDKIRISGGEFCYGNWEHQYECIVDISNHEMLLALSECEEIYLIEDNEKYIERDWNIKEK